MKFSGEGFKNCTEKVDGGSKLKVFKGTLKMR